jgi:ribosomal protein L37AE/L43A
VDVLQCGLTEADLLQGYGKPAAYCGSGCSAPPVLRVTESEWLCQACADAMQVGGAS